MKSFGHVDCDFEKKSKARISIPFSKWKIFFNLMLSDKDGENEKKRSSTILVAVGFDLVSSGIDFVTENNARVKRNRRQQEQFSH